MVRQDIETIFSVGFGKSRTGKTVTASVLDTAGVVLSSGVTIGTVIELGHGVYGVAMTFTIEFAGYIKWNNTTDTVTNYFPIVVKDDLTKIRKIMTNRWKITGTNTNICFAGAGTNTTPTGTPNWVGADSEFKETLGSLAGTPSVPDATGYGAGGSGGRSGVNDPGDGAPGFLLLNW